MSFRMVKFG